jgi:transposase
MDGHAGGRVAGCPASRLSALGHVDGRDETVPLDAPPGERGRMSERHSMRKVREILRLKHKRKLSDRKIALAIGIARSTVGEYLARAEADGLTWVIAETLGDAEVEARLFRQVGQNEPTTRAPIDFNWVHMELRRAGVTRQLLWTEYQEAVASGPTGWRPYQYSQFCDLYEEHRAKLQPSMRQVHRAGEKAFIDYSGKRPRIVDATTGEVTEVELFVMVLGASNYTYAEATRTQTLGDFVGSTVRGLEYFGAVPEMLVPDQLRSAVKTPHRYEPEINATFAEMARHYATAVVPARPRKPKDKAKVEGGVLVAQRWILASLRNRRFFSLEELNAAIWELLEKLNVKPFQKLAGCRRSVFDKLDRPMMMALPARRYEIGEWKLKVGVNIDYHVEYDHCFYSVPCALMNGRVDVRATATVIEIWQCGVRVTSHERSHGPKGTAVTDPAHRPRAHREWGNWPPERLVGWAEKMGPKTAEVVAAILTRRTHPETGRRACLGLMRLAEKYSPERLEAASGRAMAIKSPTYKSVEAILKTGFDKLALKKEVEAKAVTHENIRGGTYFDRGEVEPVKSAEEIEAEYLEEERLAIKNDRSEGPRRSEPRMESVEAVGAEVRSAVEPAPRRVVRETLPALLGRLQALWTRSTEVPGGEEPQRSREMGSSCASPSGCFGEDSSEGENMSDVRMCASDETWGQSPGLDPKEVS